MNILFRILCTINMIGMLCFASGTPQYLDTLATNKLVKSVHSSGLNGITKLALGVSSGAIAVTSPKLLSQLHVTNKFDSAIREYVMTPKDMRKDMRKEMKLQKKKAKLLAKYKKLKYEYYDRSLHLEISVKDIVMICIW